VSKLNSQKGASAGDIIKQMGWTALFTRGLGLRIIMIGTLTGLQVRPVLKKGAFAVGQG
jgi:solute carrier family 25 phosphate transporter 3